MRLQAKLHVDYYIGGLLHAILKPPTVLLGKILGRDHNLERCTTVTFIKMLGGGSLVIAYPALLAIRRAPHIRLMRLVTTPEIRPFAEVLGVFDEIIVIRDRSPLTILVDSAAAAWKLFRCDAIVDLEVHSRLTTVFSLITCARNRVGFYTTISFWRKNLATHLLFFNMCSPVYYFYDQVATLFRADVVDMQRCIETFRAHLGLLGSSSEIGRLRISLAPCCSSLSRERMLNPKDWPSVICQQLGIPHPHGDMEVHLVGAPGDSAELESLAAILQESFPAAAIVNHAGKTSLRDSILIVASTEMLFCIDSATLHFGRLLGVPTVSIWGPTDPSMLLRPSVVNRDAVYYWKVACSPCVHMADRPPCGGNNVCMRLALEPGRGSRNLLWVLR